MPIIFTDNPEQIDFHQVEKLIHLSGMRKNVKFNKVIKAFLNSSYSVYALDGDEPVGVLRVLSDGIEWSLVTDLSVLPGYDITEIAGKMMDMVISHFKGHEIFTYSSTEYISLFEEHGFFRSKNAFTFSGKTGETDRTFLDERYFLPLGFRYENEFEALPKGFPSKKKGNLKKDSSEIRFSDSLQGVDFEKLNDLLSRAFGGTKRDKEITKKAFEGSRYVQFAFDGDKLIGCARAESDGVYQGFILNVAVDPDYQGHHLGWEVVSRLSSQMEGENIFLNTHPGGVGFYNQEGFRRNKTALLYPAHPDMPIDVKRGFTLPKGYRFPDEYR